MAVVETYVWRRILRRSSCGRDRSDVGPFMFIVVRLLMRLERKSNRLIL